MTEFISVPCFCENPIKKYSKSGCYACWICENCGKFGGCDNSRNMAEEAQVVVVPKIKDVVDCEHHYHLVSGGEIKTSSPCWYQVACCKCGVGNYMMTDEWRCKFKVKNGERTLHLGSAVKGKLLRKEE